MIRGRVMCSILELMPRCNEFGMHEILVSDPNGTSHLDASVWKNEEEPEEEEQVSLLDLGAVECAQRIRALDLNTLTPIEAMNLLYELKGKL